jgi:hypothetical protein
VRKQRKIKKRIIGCFVTSLFLTNTNFLVLECFYNSRHMVIHNTLSFKMFDSIFSPKFSRSEIKSILREKIDSILDQLNYGVKIYEKNYILLLHLYLNVRYITISVFKTFKITLLRLLFVVFVFAFYCCIVVIDIRILRTRNFNSALLTFGVGWDLSSSSLYNRIGRRKRSMKI